MNPTFSNEHEQRTQQQAGAGEGSETGSGKGAHRNGNAGHAAAARVDVDRMKETLRKLGTDVLAQTKLHPQIAVGIGVGVGFIAGSIFGSRLGQLAFAGALGYVARYALGNGVTLEGIQQSLERMASTTH
ncbi:MAG TPA: hypothetical protein VGG39_32865 [Polyangiaceae bacterium]|jgi:hypothetical protein